MTPDARADLAKLVPLLGSDVDGEVLAAVRAIGRKLASRGRSFHDLAALIGGGAPVASPARPTNASQASNTLSPEAARTMARDIRMSDRAAHLSSWEQGTIAGIVARLDAGLPLARVSVDLLVQLHARIMAARA